MSRMTKREFNKLASQVVRAQSGLVRFPARFGDNQQDGARGSPEGQHLPPHWWDGHRTLKNCVAPSNGFLSVSIVRLRVNEMKVGLVE
jgi:hypothetical protein